MSFKKDVKQAVTRALRAHFRLFGTKVFLMDDSDWSTKEGARDMLFVAIWCYQGFISERERRTLVEKIVYAYGRKMYSLVKKGVLPSQVPSTEALAYALRRLSAKEGVIKIELEEGKTLEEFLRKGDGLVELVYKQLVKLPKSLELELDRAGRRRRGY